MRISQGTIQKIIAAHQLWLESNHLQGKQADFSRKNLAGIDLTDVDLREAILTKTYLEGAELSGANFSRAEMSSANFFRANLKGTKLIAAHLNSCNFFSANLNKADLTRADLSNANLFRTDLTDADLEEACLCGTNLEDARLVRVYGYGANLSLASLREADLSQAKFIQADLTDTDMSECRMHRANFDDSRFIGAKLQGSDLSEASIRRSDLSNANMKFADFSFTNVEGIKYNRWGRYRGIQAITCYGSPLFKRFALDQEYIEELRSAWWRVPLYLLWSLVSDCGRSAIVWILWSVLTAVGFGYGYFSLGADAFSLSEYTDFTLATMIYFSVVTFTTLGYGDIAPISDMAIRMVISEVVIGYIMLGGLISIIATKVARRGS